ncbi:MAG: AMP-binding protein [Beijerinckiaceae bacterium]|jgi:acyl-[acyl-carrier-protein]-phospholipid O-acyltransferase/long-chain-fatty-acid--[acyl-carrier-protein] ligase|nr:AMP-binding protein [Beijerinckiaceae bacterium]
MLESRMEPLARGSGKRFAMPGYRSCAEALLAVRARVGGKTEAAEDPERAPLTYDRLVLGALVLGRAITAGTARRERIGLLLPNVNGMLVTLFGLWFEGRVPVMLNFTAGIKNLRSAARTAQLKTIVTSRRFIDTAKLDEVVAALGETCRIVYLEDIRKGLGATDKIIGLVRSFFAKGIARDATTSANDPAVVLFTSGSEGEPKGVVLSHRNLMANAGQIFAYGADFFAKRETLFNPLPAFHSFGLTAGTLFPLFNGFKVVFYPSPLHFKQVPKLIGETKSTILLGTDTFLTGYIRAADEGDLESVKLVVAGAEKVKEETRRLWSHLPATIVEGYGCTECSPVLACNHPETNRSGTVGPVLPGVEWEIYPVSGIEEGGRLHARGPNVMLGYMLADEPGKIQPQGEWHDTGDIVAVDEMGRIAIRGRAKRFAKIGGEMVSLAAVESLCGSLWPESTHVAVTLPDAKKGEQIVLVTDRADADRAALIAHFKAEGASELFLPRAVLVLGAIPVLGSGKIDYVGTAEVAKSMRAMI